MRAAVLSLSPDPTQDWGDPWGGATGGREPGVPSYVLEANGLAGWRSLTRPVPGQGVSVGLPGVLLVAVLPTA